MAGEDSHYSDCSPSRVMTTNYDIRLQRSAGSLCCPKAGHPSVFTTATKAFLQMFHPTHRSKARTEIKAQTLQSTKSQEEMRFNENNLPFLDTVEKIFKTKKGKVNHQ